MTVLNNGTVILHIHTQYKIKSTKMNENKFSSCMPSTCEQNSMIMQTNTEC